VKRVGTWLAVAVVVIAVMWGALHVLISPVNPEQKPPEDHIQTQCWACHLVLESAEIREE
jgi:hypothetical protein